MQKELTGIELERDASANRTSAVERTSTDEDRPRGPVSKAWRLLRSLNMLWWIFFCSVLGIIFGLTAKDFSKDYLGLLSTAIFLPMLKTLIVPLIFSLLVVGIAGHTDDIGRVGRLGARALSYFIGMTVLALFVGLIFSNVVKPGEGTDLKLGAKPNNTEAPLSLQKELNQIITSNFVDSALNNRSLQVVFCAIIFAWATMLVENKEYKKNIVGFFHGLAAVMLQVVNLVMRFTPLAIGGSLAKTVASNGIGVLGVLGKLIGTVYAGLFTFILLVFLPVMLVARVPIRPFLKSVREPLIIAFTTASSDAALGIALKNMIRLGVPTEVVSFVLPLGYAFNLDGTTLYLGAALMFIAQVDGRSWGAGEQIVKMLQILLMSKGIAGVPRASLVILLSACESFGLRSEIIPVILGVDEICDMARTGVNLLGNCLACVVMARWEGTFELYHDDSNDKDADESLDTLDRPRETLVIHDVEKTA
ncbi:sodium:dicarboxylate symporter [Fimicolochytrium jonesii]|uniref:sodium:dicarboxylate symporter n=1 Tax=Fimicolochytrium jonesii TaxID=1396493 RepID=UPI0022FE82A7|nr:sodium:dicarboxylate symporter [Fimicolochytrium jonesii]KAI8821356.1 sodium:dicarboxylate symporter [Fimicolochytrium jonesii]